MVGQTENRGGYVCQTTLARQAVCAGIGLHSGKPVKMVLKPAPAGHGIVFVRTDLKNGAREIPARWDHVTETMLGTTITNTHGGKVQTVEHFMAAVAGLGIDNLVVDLDGPEIPVMDGSSVEFLRAMEEAGLENQDVPRQAIRVLKPVVICEGNKRVALLPADQFELDVKIDFDHPLIGTQAVELDLHGDAFARELAHCRTFGFLKDVEMMYSLGLALGGTLENAIVIDGDAVMNPEGLRRPDEFVRHKALDAVGDLYLAGAPIQGRFEGDRCGHDLNNRLLRALFADPDAYELVPQSGTRLDATPLAMAAE